MALATQCPHCQTTFRVAHDQLKLRAGLVRCGACKQIFNGIENLLRQEDLEQVTSRSASAESRAPEALAPSVTADETASPPGQNRENDISPEPPEFPDATSPATGKDIPKNDPLLRMTLMDFAHERREQMEGMPEEPDAVEQAIDDLERKPWRSKQETPAQTEVDALDQVDVTNYEEPSFVRQGRRRQRIGQTLHVVMVAGSLFLLGAFLLQSAYVFRDQIAVRFPQTKPVLDAACVHLGCQVGLPTRIESVAIESSELQTLAADANTFTLSVLLRNHGATDQAWPNIELTLNDANEKAIARRAFAPHEYLPSTQDAKKGFAARSEQPVKLFFKLSQLKASGYRVYLFYP